LIIRTSQLNGQNTELTKQLALEQIKSKLKESEAIPLFHEKERLLTELDSVQAHAVWLQQELEAKQKDCQHVQTQSRDRILQLQLQLNQSSDELANAQTTLSILQKVEHDLQTKLSVLTKDHLDLKLAQADAAAAAAQDLHDKQHIVDLQKEHIARWKKRCQDLEQDNEQMQQTAQKAMAASDREIEQIKSDMDTKYLALMQEQKSHYEARLQQQQQAQIAAHGNNQNLVVAIGQGAYVNEAKEDGEEDDGPFEMTDLLQRWEDAKRALRTERWQHDRTKRNYNKLVQEIRDKTPQMVRQREEFEMAVERNEELEKRLKSATQEKEFALADAKDAQKEMARMGNKLKRREEEAKTLARQVQALLIKQSGGDPNGDIPLTIRDIQTQNMKLLEEHRRLSQQVEDLEGRLNSDTLRSELDSKTSEVVTLVAERRRQEKLVEQIVQQRDLYRALVNRHDNDALGTESDELSMIDTVQKQSVKLQSLEKSHRALEDKLQQLTNELANATREKEMFQERFKRYELAYANLTTADDALQKDLLAAKAESAKCAADAEYHKEKCARLEEALERSRGEIIQLNQIRAEVQQNTASLEGELSKATAEQSRLKDENRTYESKLRSSEARLDVEKNTAARYARDNVQLRDDIARQGAMIDHIRRIENSITVKSESEMEHLKKQLSAAQEKIEALERNHSSESTEMSNKLSDSLYKIETLQTNLAKHQEESIEAKQESLDTKTELQSVKSNVRKLEAELRAARKKLGEETDDENVELELQQKVDNLESDFGKAKAEIVALQEEVENYRSLAKSGETELSKTKTAAENFKAELQEEVDDLKKQAEQRNKEFESRSELLKDLTSDLASQRGEREKIEQALKAEIQALNDKIAADAALVSSTKDSFEAYKADIERYRKDVSEAQQNYERELAKHAEARTALRTAQEAAVEHQRVREEAEIKLQTLEKEFESEKQAFEAEQETLSSHIATLEKRVEDSRDQNKLLHSQLESLNSLIAKSKDSTEPRGDDDENPENEQQRFIGELQEINKLLRADNDVCQADLDAARRALDREKAATEVLRRSLEEARSELRSTQKPATEDSSAVSEALRRELDDKNRQLLVLNDSNRVLREDAERLTQRLQKVDKDLADAKTTTQPVQDVKRELGNQIKLLEAENGSLRRELDSWKSRMNSLVKNLDQIDPEEHRKLVSQVAEMTKEHESLNAWKTNMETENQRIRAIATSQKKIMEGHQATIEDQKKVISSLEQEKENLTSKVSTATKASTKERDDLKTKVLQIEKENASLKTELQGATTSSDRLRDQMRIFKAKITSLERELNLLKKASATAAAAAAAAPKPPATDGQATAQQSVKVISAPPLPDIPKIPDGGFKFGPSANQPISEPTIKEPPTSSITVGQEEKTQSAKPAPEESAVQENKEISFKEKLKRKKLEQERELENAMKRKRDAEVEAQKRAKKNEPEKPPIESKTLAAESDEPADKSSMALATEAKTDAAAAAPPIDESTTKVKKDDDAAAAAKQKSLGKHPIFGTPPALGIPAFGQSQALRPGAMPFAPDGQSQTTLSFGVSASASSFGSITATSTTSPFGEATTASNPFARSSSGGEGISTVNPFTKSSSSGESGGSTFLSNMKAPGSSGSIPTFSFGSKTNITLPTPTLTTPSAPSPFGSSSEFRRPSASLPTPAMPLFGTSSVVAPAGTTEETTMTDVKEDDEEGQMEDVEEGEGKA
jgi:nucleoprotein TPR